MIAKHTSTFEYIFFYTDCKDKSRKISFIHYALKEFNKFSSILKNLEAFNVLLLTTDFLVIPFFGYQNININL